MGTVIDAENSFTGAGAAVEGQDCMEQMTGLHYYHADSDTTFIALMIKTKDTPEEVNAARLLPAIMQYDFPDYHHMIPETGVFNFAKSCWYIQFSIPGEVAVPETYEKAWFVGQMPDLLAIPHSKSNQRPVFSIPGLAV